MSESPSQRAKREKKLAQLRAAVAELESELVEPTSGSPASSARPTAAAQNATPRQPAQAAPRQAVGAAGAAQRSQAAAKTQTAKPQGAAKPSQPTESNDEEEYEDEPSQSLLMLIRSGPPWLVSLIVHMLLLMVLALWTISVVKKEKVFVLESPIDAMEDAELEQLTEFEASPMEAVEFEPEVALETTIPDPGQIALGDFANDTTPVAAVGELAAPSSLNDIGALFGTEGKGMAELGNGFKGAASFFGSKVKGNRFVFVVDNSNSMGKGRLETALTEMMKSVREMDGSQSFYVIFFSDTAYGLYHPKTVRTMVKATPDNKRKLEYWLPTVQMCLRTDGREAIQSALAMRPDAIYILSDGVFTDKAGDILTVPHTRKTVIHTLGMEVDPRGAKQLAAIAKANRGVYRAVAATPAARASAKNKPIKRNRNRGPVWGVKLPPAKK